MMKITKKIRLTLFMGVLLSIVFFAFSGNTAKASTVAKPTYHFVLNGTAATSSEYAMTKDSVLVSVAADGWTSPATVKWVSSEPKVVTLESTTYGTEFVNMVRKGPGYSTITAIITSDGMTFTISFLAAVNLEVDYGTMGYIPTTTTGNKAVSFDAVGATRQIALKYTDEIASGGTVVSGSAISVSAVSFKSSNENVVTVSDTGLLTAIGSGISDVTITSTTMSSKDKPMTATLRVIVRPTFTMTLLPATGSSIVHNSQTKDNSAVYAGNIPSAFDLVTNAKIANDLYWVVIDTSTGKTLSTDSAKLKYTPSDLSGNVHFEKVKAGTYLIYAYTNSTYYKNEAVPYAYMKIVVPIVMQDLDVYVQIGDTYDIVGTSNIPAANAFNYSSSDLTVATVDQATGIISANAKGTASITCTLNPSLDLFTDYISPFVITVHVIDRISLNTTSATIYTKGTLQLVANVTDKQATIIWSSANTSIATVENGLVTGVKKGTTEIKASVTIDGVTKTVKCTINVQPTVSSITLDPAKASIAIKEYKTIHATIAPSDLTGVTLQWRSSDPSVVLITEASALTATIQGVSGGNAVIAAVNQDNVVVGYTHITVQQPVTGITLSETAITVALSSNRIQLRATVAPDNAVNKNVTWKSTDAAKATVDANGLITLKGTGTVSIIATSADNPAVTAICNITISVPVTSVALDATEKTMYAGSSERLTYTLLPANASSTAVTWNSTNSKVATVDGTGLVTAKSVGTTVIILKTADGSYSVYCTITVLRTATGIKLDVATLDLAAGSTYTMSPKLSPADSTDTIITWESSDTKIAMVDANGKITGKSTGTAIITAKLSTGATAYVKVNVTQPVKGLMLNFTDKTIYVGQEFELTVSLSPSTATISNVTWKSSNTKIVTITDKGIVKGIAGGTAIITCTTQDGGFTATCVVTVKEAVSTISLNYQTYYLGVDKTVNLVATVSTPTATNQDVFWSTSNPDVATVTQKGKVTGRKLGYVTITATALDGTEVEATCEIRIVNPVTSVTLNSSSVALLVGEVKQLKASIKPSDATFKSSKWSSSDPSVAIVDEDGQVIAIKAGSTTITAEALDNSGKKAICYVTVYDRVASTGITLQDKQIVMIPGESKIVQMVLVPTASTDSVTWSSDNGAVAKVDKNTGKITARATGVAYITAMTDSGKTAQIEVIVIGLNITDLTLEQYTTYPYTLQVEGATSTVSWSIDNPQVAEVNNGVISTRGVGTATITAKVNGRKLICKLKVVKIGNKN